MNDGTVEIEYVKPIESPYKSVDMDDPRSWFECHFTNGVTRQFTAKDLDAAREDCEHIQKEFNGRRGVKVKRRAQTVSKHFRPG